MDPDATPQTAPADLPASASMSSLPKDQEGRRASLPMHIPPSVSESSLAERRRSQVSKYLETDNHKNEFAHKLREVKERERTASGGSSVRVGSGLKNQFGSSDGSGGGRSNEPTPVRATVELPTDDFAPPPAAVQHRRRSTLDDLLAIKDQFKTSPDPETQEDSAPPPLPTKDLAGKAAVERNRQMSMGGLHVISEAKSPEIGTPASGDMGDEDPDSPLPDIAHNNASNFPGFSSPFGALARANSSMSLGMGGAAADNLSPGTSTQARMIDSLSPGTIYVKAFGSGTVDEMVEQLVSAPKDTLATELTSKLAYFSALADENAQLRQLLQRQADLSPVVTLRTRFAKQHIASPQSASSSGMSDSDDSTERDEVIRSLSDQLAEQMENHDKLIYELGLIRSHHATLQALSSDYVDELELLRHQVSKLQGQVATGQAETEEVRKRKEEEEKARRDNEERIATLRSALEESKIAIKRLQDETKERRKSLVESRRNSMIATGTGHERRQSAHYGHERKSSGNHSVSTLTDRRVSTLSSTGGAVDGYTMPPARRTSTHERRASLRASQGSGHSRRLSSFIPKGDSSPEVEGSRRESMVNALDTPSAAVGLGFDLEPRSRRSSAFIAPGSSVTAGSAANGMKPGDPVDSFRPRRNSSGGVGVHIDGLAPASSSEQVVLDDKQKQQRRKDAAEGFVAVELSPSTAVAPRFSRAPGSPRQNRPRKGVSASETVVDRIEFLKMKAEMDEFEKMKVEMAKLKVQFAESEETRMATQDAFMALKQFIAEDAGKEGKEPPALPSRVAPITLPTRAATNPTAPTPVQRKVSRWAMPRLPTIVSRTASYAGSSSAASSVTSPTPSIKSLTVESPPLPSASSAGSSTFYGWGRKAETASTEATSPAGSPSMDSTPSMPVSSAFGKFSLGALVGKGFPTGPASTASDASPPSLAAESVSSAATSPVPSPKIPSPQILGMETVRTKLADVGISPGPLVMSEVDNDGQTALMDTPRVGGPVLRA